MKQLNDIINKYYNGELTLFDFETKIINFPQNNDTNDLINEILEDIAYTKKGTLTKEDKQYSLITESALKNKLKVYLNKGGNL